MSHLFKLSFMNVYNFNFKIILQISTFFIMSSIFFSENVFSNTKEPKVSINGSGLEIPRIVSLKNSLTYLRSGPGREFPVKFELRQKGYPLKVIAEFNNWRKVITFNKITGWIHTQLLSSIKTGLITETTFLKTLPSNSSGSLAKLLPNLLINVKSCAEKWCKIEIIKNKKFVGWIKKASIWGSVKN